MTIGSKFKVEKRRFPTPPGRVPFDPERADRATRARKGKGTKHWPDVPK